MIFVGVDPGLTGAIAVINEKGVVLGVWDIPVTKVKGKSQFVPSLIVGVFREATKGESKAIVAIEFVRSMPKQGVASSFGFGRGVGILEGIIAALDLPHMQVTPQVWKKAILGPGERGDDKSASILSACRIFPLASQYLTLKKHDGRAEALLIAEYARRYASGTGSGKLAPTDT